MRKVFQLTCMAVLATVVSSTAWGQTASVNVQSATPGLQSGVGANGAEMNGYSHAMYPQPSAYSSSSNAHSVGACGCAGTSSYQIASLAPAGTCSGGYSGQSVCGSTSTPCGSTMKARHCGRHRGHGRHR